VKQDDSSLQGLEAPGTPTPSPPKPRRAATGERVAAAFLAAATLGVLLLAAWLEPDRRGHGTFEAIGAPCVWASVLGKPCPTCGMTTAFSHAVRADLPAAAKAQPFGLVLAVGTAGLFWVCLYVAATGSLVGVALSGLLNRWSAALLIAGLVAGWVYKTATWTGL